MLHLGIDLHAKQITVNLRDEKGDAVLRRQVSTAGDKPGVLFFPEVTLLAGEGGYVAILDVCGFQEVQGVRRITPPMFAVICKHAGEKAALAPSTPAD